MHMWFIRKVKSFVQKCVEICTVSLFWFIKELKYTSLTRAGVCPETLRPFQTEYLPINGGITLTTSFTHKHHNI